MEESTLFFFNQKPGLLPLYEQLENLIFSRLDGVEVRVQKTQISFYQRRLFACVSFLPARPKKERPPQFFTLTLGLGRRLDSPRVDAAVEPYPGRWTHHIMLSEIGRAHV